METAIRVNKKNAIWWRDCCKRRNVSSVKLFTRFREGVGKHKDKKFYDLLPRPQDYVKPLQFKKIEKKYT